MYDKLCPTWENAAGGSLQIDLFQAMIKILPRISPKAIATNQLFVGVKT